MLSGVTTTRLLESVLRSHPHCIIVLMYFKILQLFNKCHTKKKSRLLRHDTSIHVSLSACVYVYSLYVRARGLLVSCISHPQHTSGHAIAVGTCCPSVRPAETWQSGCEQAEVIFVMQRFRLILPFVTPNLFISVCLYKLYFLYDFIS